LDSTPKKFSSNFFVRTFVTNDVLKKIRHMILNYERDPHTIMRIRAQMSAVSRNIILLHEVLLYIRESVDSLKLPPEKAGGLSATLNIKGLYRDVATRARDLQKLTQGLTNQLNNLQQMGETIKTKKLEENFLGVESNTKFLVAAAEANIRGSESLEVMQIILAGSFIFDLIDRLSGGTLNIGVPPFIEEYFQNGICDIPFLWFLLNLLIFVVLGSLLYRFMHYLQDTQAGVLTFKKQLNLKIYPKMFRLYLDSKDIDVMDQLTASRHAKGNSNIIKLQWQENHPSQWGMYSGKQAPRIELMVDFTNCFLVEASFQVNVRHTSFRERDLLRKLITDLCASDCLDDGYGGLKAFLSQKKNSVGNLKLDADGNVREFFVEQGSKE